MLMTVIVPTVVVLAFSLFASMAIVPMLFRNQDHGKTPDNVVQLDQARRSAFTMNRPAA